MKDFVLPDMKKISPEQKSSGETISQPKKAPVKDEAKNNSAEKEMMDAFNTFNEKTTKLKPDASASASSSAPSSGGDSSGNSPAVPASAIDFSLEIKIKMFLGALCYLLSGFHVLLFNLITKKQVVFEDMELTDPEKDSLRVYLNTPAILEMLNKIPGWVWGIVHVEFLFFNKLKRVTTIKVKAKTKTKNKNEDDE